jgi:hypothetical protein
MLLGPTMDPRIASELSLRVPHLGLRMREHGERAALLAQRLEKLGAKVSWLRGRGLLLVMAAAGCHCTAGKVVGLATSGQPPQRQLATACACLSMHSAPS